MEFKYFLVRTINNQGSQRTGKNGNLKNLPGKPGKTREFHPGGGVRYEAELFYCNLSAFKR